MKKSKIILPAVALLTISTVAAASSTVAWFTAGRSVTVKGTTVSVYNPESSLKVTLGADEDNNSTTLDGTDTTGKTVKLPEYMRDASVNAADGTIYKRDILDENKYYTAAYLEDKVLVGSETKDVYRAAKWTMTFKMDAAATDSYKILLKPSVQSVKNIKGTAYKSFRIAFVADGKVAIYAPFSDETTTYSYIASVSGSNAATKDTYAGVISNTATKQATELAKDDADKLTAAQGLIGTIPAKNGDAEKGLEVTCYAWFEGEDPNCVVTDEGVAGDITTVLEFYAVRVTTAA